MICNRFQNWLGLTSAIFLSLTASILPDSTLANSTQTPRGEHGVALFGEPALPRDFKHLPSVNPFAPKGGRFVDGQVGSFDSLNPHIQKGRTPWQLRFLAYESLLVRSWDEPFTLYGLIAEGVKIAPKNDAVTFYLNPKARFSDGSPVTVDDVLWSFETLGTKGHGRYRGSWARVVKAEALDSYAVHFTLDKPDRELAMILGMRPILQKAQWQSREFEQSGLDVIPISTAPYVITDFEAGRFVELTRNPDYWGKDLPVRKGVHNIDVLRMEYFGDATAMQEAFKAGAISSIRETNAARWNTQYDFPRALNGEVVKSIIPHQRPSGITGFAMNTRLPFFADWRVREAMIQAFNFEYINGVLNGGAPQRIVSYYSNSPLAMRAGPAKGAVQELLAPYENRLFPGTLEGYTLPVTNGTVANRKGLRTAMRLLNDAGYKVDTGRLMSPSGEAVTLEIMLKHGSAENSSIADIYVEALKRLGIEASVTIIDDAQFRERTDQFDFQMVQYTRGNSLSPGNEQKLYWGSEAAETQGSRNWAGISDPVVDAMIEAMLAADSQEAYFAAIRALDRVLIAGRYVVPFWQNPFSRIAHDARLHYPKETLPIYGDWLGFQPDIWWWEE